jgi:hypothetical protein
VASTTVITIWHALPAEYSTLFDSVMNTYPGKTNGMVKLDIRRFDSLDALHKALLEPGHTPDMALIDTGWQEEINRHKPLKLMEDLILEKVGRSVFIVFKMDTFPEMWAASKSGEKLMSMPFTGYNRALIVNNSIFSRHSKKPPKTWKEVIDIGKVIAGETPHDHPDKNWGFIMPSGDTPEELAMFFQLLLVQMNKDILEPFLDGDLVAFDGPEGRYVLGMMADMIHKHRIHPASPVEKEKVAMFVGCPRDYLKLMEQGKSVSVIRLPSHKNYLSDLVVYSFVVFNGPDEKKMDKIWHLLYDSCEFQPALKWSMETCYLPPNKQVTLSPGYFSYLNGYPGMKIFLQQVKNSRPTTMSKDKARVMTILGENIRLCLDKKIGVDECIDASSKHANMIMDPQGALRAKKEQLKEIGLFVDKVWEKDNK